MLIVSIVLLSSCSNFHRVMKSNDMEQKYATAVKYYEEQDYYHALQLFEEVMSVFRGTNKAELSLYYYAYCTYYIDDYQTAAYHFNNFVQTYPNSVKAEEMQYMYAYCFYQDSPVSSLDQTSTKEAIAKFQIFINRYPESSRVKEANDRIDELRFKLETKAFDNAMMYYKTGYYKAAVSALEEFMNDYPGSSYKEEALYTSLKAGVELARNSIDSRKKERYQLARDQYYKLIDSFPQSKYLREAEKLFEEAQDYLAKSS